MKADPRAILMTASPRHGCRLVLAVASVTLGLLAPARIVNGQDDDIGEAAPAAPAFAWPDEVFDQWVYNGAGNAAAGRARVEASLALAIDDIDRACSLTDAQKKKLRLAGEGDIKRFQDRVEEKRKVFNRVKHDQNKVNEVFQEIQPLQAMLSSGLFGEGSVFSKVVKSTLDSAQAGRYDRVARERRGFRYRAKIRLAVTMLGDAAGLVAEQRNKLATLLEQETQPPLKFGQYDYYLVLFQASKLPETTLRPLFDDAQWKVVSQHLLQVRGWDQLLRQQGYVLDDDPSARPGGAANSSELQKAR